MFRDERAQSEVIGTVLLLGLTILVVGSTVALGSVALADSQETADLQRVEGAMTQLDSKASLVAHGESPTQMVRMDVGRTANFRVDEDAGWMRIEVESGESENNMNETIPLGAVVYERGGETVAYQGGGVWRSSGDSVRMVSPPEFHYRGSGGTETLTLPLVTIEDSGGPLQDSVRVTKTERGPDRLFPSGNNSNPLVGGNVTITVQSEYAEAWGRFFESRTSATVIERSDRQVTVRLRTETVHPTLGSSVSATGRSTLDMGGVDRMYADSYDSEQGSYESQDPADGALIQTRDEFRLSAGGGGGTDSITIRGDLSAESYNIPPGQEDKLNVSGEMRTETAFAEPNPVEGGIVQRIAAIRDLDLATGESNRSGIDLSGGGTETIDENTYVDGDVVIGQDGVLTVADGATLHVAGRVDIEDSGEMIFDTTNGDIQTLIENKADLSNDGSMRVVGGNVVEVYVDDEIELENTASITTASDTRIEIYNTDEIELRDEVRITADDDVASNLWMYTSAENIEIVGGSGGEIVFTGVFYAPQSDVRLENKMTIKGSFTFRNFQFNNGDINIHYDESLRMLQPFDGDSVPVVSHLHVSTHGVVIDSD